MRHPIVTSLWPFMYLDSDCIEMSAPSISGFWKYDDMNVLSTTMRISGLIDLAIKEIARMSAIFIVGLDGVSSQIIFVLFLIALETFADLVASTNDDSTPKFFALFL